MFQLITVIVSIALAAAITVTTINHIPIGALTDHRVAEQAEKEFAHIKRAVKRHLLSDTDADGVPNVISLEPIKRYLTENWDAGWLNDNSGVLICFTPNKGSDKVLDTLKSRFGAAAVKNKYGCNGVGYIIDRYHLAPPVMPSIIYKKNNPPTDP